MGGCKKSFLWHLPPPPLPHPGAATACILNVVNDLKNDSSYEFIGEVILKINVV